jgi:hypothetical protein
LRNVELFGYLAGSEVFGGFGGHREHDHTS